MALVTIVGFPCSGKSKRSEQLKLFFEQKLQEAGYDGPKLSVVVIDDESCHVPRSVYDDSKVEKSGRANLFSSLLRSLGPDTIVICDSLNYIKGFRYQMNCAAKEAHARFCTIHIATPPERCREWHEQRGESSSYKPATFDNLIMRFEEPSSMVRWDSPLFTIPWDEDPPYEAIWNTITAGAKAPPTGAVKVVPKPAANTLQILTNTTSAITSSILAHSNSNPNSSSITLPSPPAPIGLVLNLPMRRLTLSEMQRLKRQFEKVQTVAVTSNGRAAGTWTEESVSAKFVSFLETIWDT